MRVGTDILEIERIKKAINKAPKLVNNILGMAELEIYHTLSSERQLEFIAGRFAAKEAYGKALGVGVETLIKLKDIVILPDQWGAPYVKAGPVTDEIALSISHSQAYATATVVCSLTDDEIRFQLDQWRQHHPIL